MERKIKVISNEISTQKEILEDKLEKLMNSNEPLGEIKGEIIGVLKEIALNDSLADVWNSYLPNIINK